MMSLFIIKKDTALDNNMLADNNINSEFQVLSSLELLPSMKGINLNFGYYNYHQLTPTNLTGFPAEPTSIVNLNNTATNFNIDTNIINYYQFSTLNFYSSPDLDYYTLFNFLFTYKFTLLPVILLLLYNLKDLFINCFADRINNSNWVDIREDEAQGQRWGNSTVSNSTSNSYSSNGSSGWGSGGSGGDGNDGNGNLNNGVRGLSMFFTVGVEELRALAERFDQEYRDVSADIKQ